MSKLSANLVICVVCGIFSLLFFAGGIYFLYDKDRFKGVLAFIVAMYWTGATFCTGHKYYIKQKDEFCPNCYYQYQAYEDYTYCPECGTKLKNQCDSCGKILSDKDINICPYCGKEIEFKVGDIPNDSN